MPLYLYYLWFKFSRGLVLGPYTRPDKLDRENGATRFGA